MARAGRSQERIDVSKPSYKLGQEVGSGTFGSVFKAFDRNGQVVAIKRVKRISHSEIGREIAMNLLLKHPNVVELLDVFFTRERHQDSEDEIIVQNLVFEWLPMNLHQYSTFHRISMRSTPPREELRKITKDVLQALNHLHTLSPPMCHRDLKLDNILLDLQPFRAKLCDFGSSKLLHGDTESKNIAIVFPREYRPIELLLGSTAYSTSADIWAFGVVVAELLIGNVPFAGSDEAEILIGIYSTLGSPSQADLSDMGIGRDVFQVPFRAKRDAKKWGFCDQDLGKLALQCLTFSPKKRPSAAQLLKSPIFASMS